MTTIQAIESIGIDPDIRNRRPYIIGTTVTVADIAIARLYHGPDAEGIADWCGLDLHQAYAALAYYYDYRDQIDEAIQTDQAFIEELHKMTPSKLPEKLRGRPDQVLHG